MQMNSGLTVMNGDRWGGVGEGGSGSQSAGLDVMKRGTKRDASDSNLSDFERFEKRLRMLTLRSTEHKRKDRDKSQLRTNTNTNTSTSTPTPPEPTPTTTTSPPQAPTHPDTSYMQIEDTPHRVYIHDLDAELASIESTTPPPTSDRLIFLPDIEAAFSRIPPQLLSPHPSSSSEEDARHQQLILYDVPRPVTTDDATGNDSVRKAILEARARAREKAVEEDSRRRAEDLERRYGHDVQAPAGMVETAHGYGGGYSDHYAREHDLVEDEDDEDAMDIS